MALKIVTLVLAVLGLWVMIVGIGILVLTSERTGLVIALVGFLLSMSSSGISLPSSVKFLRDARRGQTPNPE